MFTVLITGYFVDHQDERDGRLHSTFKNPPCIIRIRVTSTCAKWKQILLPVKLSCHSARTYWQDLHIHTHPRVRYDTMNDTARHDIQRLKCDCVDLRCVKISSAASPCTQDLPLEVKWYASNPRQISQKLGGSYSTSAVLCCGSTSAVCLNCFSCWLIHQLLKYRPVFIVFLAMGHFPSWSIPIKPSNSISVPCLYVNWAHFVHNPSIFLFVCN